MYLLALLIVELQMAKRRLITIFDEPDGTSKEQSRNTPNVHRAEIGRTFDAHQNRIAGSSMKHDVDLGQAKIG
jgi:hypothetical protein